MRHKVPEGEGRVRLSGYGVELQIKSTEYKVGGHTCQEAYFSCFLDNNIKCQLQSVLRTRDVYPVSEFFPSRIPDPGSKRFPNPHPHLRTIVFEPKKLFLSSRKYDLGCSSRIRILIFFTHPGSRIQGKKGTGSRIRICVTGSSESCSSAVLYSVHSCYVNMCDLGDFQSLGHVFCVFVRYLLLVWMRQSHVD